MVSAKTASSIQSELLRLEEDCIHSGKAHFNAANRWLTWHYVFGIPSVVLATAAGTAFFKDYPTYAGVMASTVAVLSGLMTFLKPSERSSGHKSSGDQYLALRNDSRVFREIELPHIGNDAAAISAVSGLTKRRNELNAASQPFSRSDFENARKGIHDGEATHEVDKIK